MPFPWFMPVGLHIQMSLAAVNNRKTAFQKLYVFKSSSTIWPTYPAIPQQWKLDRQHEISMPNPNQTQFKQLVFGFGLGLQGFLDTNM